MSPDNTINATRTSAVNVTFTAISLTGNVFIAVFLVLTALCWLCEKKPNAAAVAWNAIVVLWNVCQAMIKGVYTTGKNEDPDVEEPESADSSGDQAYDQTPGSLTADLVPPSLTPYVSFSQLGQIYKHIYCHLYDQLNWWHSNGDPKLAIVGELFGGLIAQGIILNLSDDWKPEARTILNYLENDDIKYVNFAQSAFKTLKKDLPPRK
ncbi:Hypothetical protein CINCED_3A021078 [Cinara cedri]|uniref:Uncharacterized protein n=1 Tax=Cinara cedri TaxID=506608 RepID=A0A5E4N0H1_9HEMI|nr:Hypothetical protein CINCED_3A021078 [Cinara cedri]